MPKGEVDTTSGAHVNPDIYKLENKPKALLQHEVGIGSPCLKCDCPGLDLHFWRKICKICSHKMEDHDVISPEQDHGRIIIGRLFDFLPTFETKTAAAASASEPFLGPAKKTAPSSQFNVKIDGGVEQDNNIEYTWVPTGDRLLAEKYFEALPEDERPLSGTAGALDRRQKLQYQLPYYDSNAAAARSIKTDADRDLHTKFITVVKEKVVGVGQLVEWKDVMTKISSASSSVSSAGSLSEGGRSQKVDFGTCRTCGESMKPGEVGVVTDHGPVNEIWHPNCFRCFTCQQRLVDMLYFYKDGEYYCGRHFGDTMYPRCAGCDELIFSKEYTFAESKNWHFDHFCCFGCDKQLGGHRYMVREEQPYCFDCYMNKFARICQACHNKIAPDQQRISYKDLHWHAEGRCFQCRLCRKVLLNQKFIIKNEEVFCSGDCKNKFFA